MMRTVPREETQFKAQLELQIKQAIKKSFSKENASEAVYWLNDSSTVEKAIRDVTSWAWSLKLTLNDPTSEED